jgi:hypothetical protein
MKSHLLAPMLGISAAIISAAAVVAPTSAATFRIGDGKTSVFLDTALLESAAGLALTGTSSDVLPPISDSFLVGFQITSETDFTFSDDNGFTYLGGSIEHTGSVTFNNAISVGNFSIGFDANRVGGSLSGFFVQDKLTTNAILFDIANVVPTLANGNATIAGDLLVSQEFASFLSNDGLAGALIGSAQTDAAAVPEPTTMAGIALAGSALLARRRNRKASDA